MVTVRTLKVRVKDKHAPLLCAMAREVNSVWNYCNGLSERLVRERREWPTGYDLHPYLVGSTACFEHIGSATIDEVRDVYAKSRRQACKARLAWRVSNPARRNYSLGWVPFKSRAASWRNGQVRFAGHFFHVWDSYGPSAYPFRAGAFVEDRRGRWYFTVQVALEVGDGNPAGLPLGIDPGLADVATTSDGLKCPSRRYRALESDIGKAQRHARTTGKRTVARRRVRALHAKVANRRKDDAHQFFAACRQRSQPYPDGRLETPGHQEPVVEVRCRRCAVQPQEDAQI